MFPSTDLELRFCREVQSSRIMEPAAVHAKQQVIDCAIASRQGMGRPIVQRLEGNIFTCCICTAHLALKNDLVSKVSKSRPFLFRDKQNVDDELGKGFCVIRMNFLGIPVGYQLDVFA